MPDTPDDAFINGSVEGSRFDHRGEPTMPDTLSREELDGHRAYLALHRPDCRCTGSRLLVHIDALTGAVEALLRAWENNRYTEDVTEEVAAVLAILRGKK
jgi:hypothetical protein